MAVLGNCPSAGNFATATPFIVVNEVTTVAAAYAMAGFALDATDVSSSGSALSETGIANAFANAANLADLASGSALATTPGGNGTPPQSEIYTLANVLAACINSSSMTNPTACSTLFSSALSGGTTGTQPTDTATAAINIAHNPGANVGVLYGLAAATPPFAPALTAQPNDFTVGIQFTGGGLNDPYSIAIDGAGDVWAANNGGSVGTVTELASNGTAISSPIGYTDATHGGFFGIAIDLSGNAWVPSNTGNCLVEFSSLGVVSSGVGGFTGGGLNDPYAVAVDGLGNVWATNIGVSGAGANSVSEFTNGGSPTSTGTGYIGGNLSDPFSIAMDSTGNAWVANKSNSTVTKLDSTGTVQSGMNGYNGGGLSVPYSVAIDGGGNVWIADQGGIGTGNVAELSNGGDDISPSSGYTGGGLSSPDAIALDGAGNAWVADQTHNAIEEFLNSGGTAISPSTGYVVPGVNQTVAIAVDGSGDVWVADPSTIQLTELVGAAAPVVTPLAAGALNSTLATRP